MVVVVLGASGGVGRHVVAQAAEAGDRVVAVVRPGTPFEAPAGVAVRRAEVLEPGVLADVVEGADVVLSCLGMKRRSLFPWSAPTSPTDLTSRVAHGLVAALAPGSRVCAISAAGVGDSAPDMNLVMRTLVASSTIGLAYRDLALMEEGFAASELDWCCVRPVTLTNGPRSGAVREVDHFGPMMTIARADVAAWMLAWSRRGGPPRTPQIAGR